MTDMLVEYFKWKVNKGFEARGLAGREEYEQRLAYETKVIHKMEYESYLLVVADFISWARNQGIPVGPGRGSAAGCLISYCLGITNIDPIKYNLLFERISYLILDCQDIILNFENEIKVLQSELIVDENRSSLLTILKLYLP
mgnify:CR=1 FL=1